VYFYAQIDSESATYEQETESRDGGVGRYGGDGDREETTEGDEGGGDGL